MNPVGIPNDLWLNLDLRRRRADTERGNKTYGPNDRLRKNDQNAADDNWRRPVESPADNSGVSDRAKGALVAGNAGGVRMYVDGLDDADKRDQQDA
jgi:hypothetical protein